MNLNSVIFIDSLPKIDLHGYDRETARVSINDFIKDNKRSGKSIFVIVHGNGSGILKDTTQKVLKSSKDVIEYQIRYNNTGCTIVRIKIWQKSLFMVILNYQQRRKPLENKGKNILYEKFITKIKESIDIY